MCVLMIQTIEYDDDAMQTTSQANVEISACNCDLDNGDVDLLSKAIRFNQSYLVSINLEQNALEAYAVSVLCNHLSTNNIQLRSLNLAHNLLGVNGMTHVGKYLQYSSKLKSLNLSNNTIRSKGTRTLLQYLYDHPSLTHFNMSGNRVDTAATIDFIAVSLTCGEMSEVHMEDNICDSVLTLNISKILCIKYNLHI